MLEKWAAYWRLVALVMVVPFGSVLVGRELFHPAVEQLNQEKTPKQWREQWEGTKQQAGFTQAFFLKSLSKFSWDSAIKSSKSKRNKASKIKHVNWKLLLWLSKLNALVLFPSDAKNQFKRALNRHCSPLLMTCRGRLWQLNRPQQEVDKPGSETNRGVGRDIGRQIGVVSPWWWLTQGLRYTHFEAYGG